MTEGVKTASGGKAAPDALQEELRTALTHLKAGRLAQAREAAEAAVRRNPGSASALHLRGLVAHAEGERERAIELLKGAIALDGTVASFHTNLAEIYRSQGRHPEAAACCRQAIALGRPRPDAHAILGAVLTEQGRFEEAESELRRAIQLKPDLAAAHANLGKVLQSRDRLSDAAEAYRAALRCEPKLAGVHRSLGDVLRDQKNLDEAAASYRAALDRAPEDARAWFNLGACLQSLERHEEAGDCFEKAVALRPDHANAHYNLGTVRRLQGRVREAARSYARALELRHRPLAYGSGGADVLPSSPDRVFTVTTAAKLRHDIEQFRCLIAKGLLPETFARTVADYEAVLEEVAAEGGPSDVKVLSPAQRRRIGATYNRLVHLAEAPALPAGAVNKDLDARSIEERYFASSPGVVHFDGFLNEAALESLRRFCLESTIWFDFEHRNGYVGAFFSEGFNCPLLLQIAEELRAAFPRVLEGRDLRYLWAFKYDSRLGGIRFHADAAAVNVNFWITPDDSNLDPQSGGLVVYPREAPLEWDFDRYNKDQQAIRDFLEGCEGVKIPHRRNRVVMFNSNLFHKTDDIRFKEGYENRRINITMLFGDRGDAP